MKHLLRAFVPHSLVNAYHLAYARASAFVAGNPSHQLVVIGVTGTKGKSTTTELIRAVLQEAGYKTAVASTIRFAIGEETEPNLFKMTMPGRGYLQRFLRKALDAGCTHAVIEMTSEGARQHRHIGIELDALVFTNLAPEHIESHGGLEAYKQAKLSLARHLEQSPKRPRIIVANADDQVGQQFLEAEVDKRAPFSLKDAEPYNADERGGRFVWRGQLFSVPLPGLFNLKNCLAVLALGEALGLSRAVMKRALERPRTIPGRAERVEKGQPFTVVVDYAHTPDSLRALFETYKNRKIVSVIGSTGGGRDTWNRPEKGKAADAYCEVAFITNEDPYDEDPQNIMEAIASGFTEHKPHIVPDRRAAIRNALKEARNLAQSGEQAAVLITGKGTDPYIMGPSGTKQPWSDRRVAEEELEKLGYN